MWCPDGIGRDSWDRGGQESVGWLAPDSPRESGKKPSPRVSGLLDETNRLLYVVIVVVVVAVVVAAAVGFGYYVPFRFFPFMFSLPLFLLHFSLRM